MQNTNVMRLSIPMDADVEQAVRVLEQQPGVLWAEPDYLAYTADTTPDDTRFCGQWGPAQVSAPAAWDTVTGTQTVDEVTPHAISALQQVGDSLKRMFDRLGQKDGSAASDEVETE